MVSRITRKKQNPDKIVVQGLCHSHYLFVSMQDGRLAAGDQLLSVDGRSLVGLSQER